MRFLVPVAVLASVANAYFLTGINRIATERIDPIISPGQVAGHVHALFGGSGLRITTDTATLRQSFCTSVGIKQDKSAYWFPELYFHGADDSFTSVDGGGVVYYLYEKNAKPFPVDFRMISGNPALRSYDPSSFAQQAVSFLCLDFQHGTPPPFTGLPPMPCPDGIRAQINFPSCWDGVHPDSADHKSHVAFPSGGPDKGTCSDPKYPITIPRIFFELYFATGSFNTRFGEAKDTKQPFVFAQGDPTGYGYHGDFINGWDDGVLEKIIDGCYCNNFGDAKCCQDLGIFTINSGQDMNCHVTKTWDEQTTGKIPGKLPGNNPVEYGPGNVTPKPNDVFPARLDPVFAYLGDTPPGTGTVIAPGSTGTSRGGVLINLPSNTSSPAVPSSSATIPPAQPTTTPKDSTPVPVPSSTSGGTGPSPTPTADRGFCYSSKDNALIKKPARKRHLRRTHNALGESF